MAQPRGIPSSRLVFSWTRSIHVETASPRCHTVQLSAMYTRYSMNRCKLVSYIGFSTQKPQSKEKSGPVFFNLHTCGQKTHFHYYSGPFGKAESHTGWLPLSPGCEGEGEAERDAREVSFREIKLVSLSVCSGWYFIYQRELRCCDPPPHSIPMPPPPPPTSTAMSVSDWPRRSPAGDNRLNLFHFMPQAPKYNPCGAPSGPVAPLCPPLRAPHPG